MSKIEQKNRAELSGNTKDEVLPRVVKKKIEKKHRSYCLTIFKLAETEELKKMDYKYIVVGEEICPETKKIHHQCFIQFKNSKSLNAIKKKLPTAHIEKCKGSDLSNMEYCKKDGKILFEDGLKPYGKLTAKELKEMSVEDIINFDARCHGSYLKAKNILENDLDVDELNKDINVYYIQGPSGIGKTEKAKNIIRDNKEKYGTKLNMIKYENGFYNGIGAAKIALYDDFRDSHMKASEFINLIDYNIHTLNIKGGQVQNKYELMIFTSVQKLSEIYANMKNEPRKQWERRIKLIDLYNKN